MSATETRAESKALNRQLHVDYIESFDKKKEDFQYWVTEHLRVSGYYWGFSALFLLDADTGTRGDIADAALASIKLCYDEESGGFGGNQGHDAHLLYTLSAVQVFVLFDRLGDAWFAERVKRIGDFVASKQLDDGSFCGDKWGEVDTRFSYIAMNCLSLLGMGDAIDVDAAVGYVLRCQNFDGAFGVVPGAESHAGQTFCCVGALAIAGRLGDIDADLLGWWLCERQLPCGGLNGRPQKLPDVCYSWWVLSALSCLDRLHWINGDKLVAWILECQDPDAGGFADRPNDRSDIFHTFFGLAGLSLLGYPQLTDIDPAFAMPRHILERNHIAIPSNHLHK
jgi:geranylgeranyl transferase type-2 subunit beta